MSDNPEDFYYSKWTTSFSNETDFNQSEEVRLEFITDKETNTARVFKFYADQMLVEIEHNLTADADTEEEELDSYYDITDLDKVRLVFFSGDDSEEVFEYNSGDSTEDSFIPVNALEHGFKVQEGFSSKKPYIFNGKMYFNLGYAQNLSFLYSLDKYLTAKEIDVRRCLKFECLERSNG